MSIMLFRLSPHLRCHLQRKYRSFATSKTGWPQGIPTALELPNRPLSPQEQNDFEILQHIWKRSTLQVELAKIDRDLAVADQIAKMSQKKYELENGTCEEDKSKVQKCREPPRAVADQRANTSQTKYEDKSEKQKCLELLNQKKYEDKSEEQKRLELLNQTKYEDKSEEQKCLELFKTGRDETFDDQDLLKDIFINFYPGEYHDSSLHDVVYWTDGICIRRTKMTMDDKWHYAIEDE